MNSIFSTDKLPALLLTLVGLIGYQLNYISTNAVNSPIVEYNFKELHSNDSNDSSDVECVIENISQAHSFDSLNVYFLYEPHIPCIIYNAHVIAIHPSTIPDDGVEKHHKMIAFNFVKFHPGFKYIMRFSIKGNLKKFSFPYIFIRSENTILLKEKTFFTFFIKNQFSINLTALISLFILLAVYVYFLLNARRR